MLSIHIPSIPIRSIPFNAIRLNAVWYSLTYAKERLEQIKSARGGGSITPRYSKILKQHIAGGSVSLHTYTALVDRAYDANSGTWAVTTSPPIDGLPPIDYIYFATGIQSDFTTLPYLKTMNEQYPIPSQGGLPCLNDDLMWKDKVPLFVTGRLASLRLGPGAGNLAGARVGAERISWSIQDVLGKRGGAAALDEEDNEEDAEFNYHIGRGNRFDSLIDDNDDSDAP